MIYPENSPNRGHPYPISTFDIETDTNFNVLDIGLCLEYPEVLLFNSSISFLNFVEKYMEERKINYIQIWGHNAGRFDCVCIINDLIPFLIDVNVLMSGNIVINWTLLLKNGNRIDISDSMRLINVSLAKATKAFNVEHVKLELNVLPHILKKRDPEKYFSYLKHDVLGLHEVLQKFCHVLEANFGAFNKIYTAAGVAFHIFKRHLKRKIYTPKTPRLKDFEKRSYKGAICHLEIPGKHQSVAVLDVNSLYPYVMSINEYPVSERGYWTSKYIGQKGIYICKLMSSKLKSSFPFLYGDKGLIREEGEIFFADHLTLDYLQKKEIDFEVVLGHVYLEWGHIFDYMNNLYELRKNDALKHPIKIIMNSSYGKFAQNVKQNYLALATPHRMEQLKNGDKKYKDYGEFVMWEDEVENKEKFDAISSCVLLQARLHMRRLMDIIKGEVIYVDTDSLHIPLNVATRLKKHVGNEMGQLKIEFIGEALYLGKKLYILYPNEHYKGGVKSKGLSKVDITDLEKAFNHGSHTVQISRFFTLREGLMGSLKIMEIEKIIKPTSP